MACRAAERRGSGYLGAMDRSGGEGAFRERLGEIRRPTSRELEQRLDRWVSAGRQLVDGVAGARPGSRPPSRSAGPGRPGALGRWLEDRIDWLLDDGDDWREPWQENAPAAPRRPLPEPSAPAPPPLSAPPPQSAPPRRRSLEAISRRGAAPVAPAPTSPPGDWPDDESFTLPRWQRPAPTAPVAADLTRPPQPPPEPTGRPLPRSTRRRP